MRFLAKVELVNSNQKPFNKLHGSLIEGAQEEVLGKQGRDFRNLHLL